MSASAIGDANLPRSYGIPLWLALVAAGLAGNYYKYPIFLNIDFLFGSIFAMLALQFFGLFRGIAAATLIAGVTYLLWNHPYAILIMTAEVAAVGWLIGRYKIGLVLADALYWLVLGMPLVYIFYHGVMGVPPGNTAIVMTKQAANGIANALLARLIFTGFALKTRTLLIAYRDIIYNLLTFFALCPALILLMVASSSDFTETDNNIRTELGQNSLRIGNRLEVWLRNRTPAIVNLAALAATLTPAQMQSRLEQAHAADVNFQRIGMLNKAGVTTAFSPPIDELGQSNIGRNFADRPYIPELRQTLKPMLSEVVMGRIGTPRPIVLLLAPISIRGEYAGYVSGILSLEQIRDYLEKTAEKETLVYTLVDKNGNIILTNRKDQQMMAPFARGQGVLNRLDGTIAQWVPTLPPNTPIMERWKASFYVAETPIGNLAEWKLIIEQPVAPFQKVLYARYTRALTLLFLVLIAALALAEFLSRRVAATTEQLSELTHDLPATVETGAQTAWPESVILESNKLIENFRETAMILSAQVSANRQLNSTLEQRVNARTAELKESETRFRGLADSAPALVWASGRDKLCNYFNLPWLKFTGRTLEQELGNGWEEGVYPDDLTRCLSTYTEAFDRQEVFSMEYRLRRHDGEFRWVRDDGCPRYDSNGEFMGYLGYVMDITERKQGELALERANRALRTLSACNEALIHAEGEPELLNNICRLIVDTGGYRMAWVGFAERNSDKTIDVAAHHGADDSYLEFAKITWADTKLGGGPTGMALKTGATQVNNDIQTSPNMAPWRDAALARGFQSSIAIPLRGVSNIPGALSIYASETDAFKEDEVRLLEELANDLAFGITTLRTRTERDRMTYAHLHHEELIRKSLEESIQAISNTVEMRDPYTAGHQNRVCQLAIAIANELELPKAEIHGIQLAASIHDLGKIKVPAEILSKPGKLTDIEFMLIKVHPQAGYDILKGIEFPWPIASIVLQHHERLDGSGYPQRLKGSQILLGSRIIAVADVVEAMASHRPYRPALGFEVALAEIEKGRGTVFDSAAVDACLKLFRDGRFAFQS